MPWNIAMNGKGNWDDDELVGAQPLENAPQPAPLDPKVQAFLAKTGGKPDINEALDPKIKEYLRNQVGASMAERTPEYQASLRADASDAAAAKRSNNLGALLMNSAAKIGQIGGKQADSSEMDKFAQNQNRGIDQEQAALAAQTAQADQIDPRVVGYIKNEETNAMRRDNAATRAQTASAAADARVEAAKAIADGKAQHDRERTQDKKERDAIAYAAKATAAGEKSDKATNERFDKFDQRIAGTVRDEIGAEKTKLRSATHAFGILDQYPDLNKVNNKQALEIAGAMAGTLTQGSPAEHTIQQMTPSSAMGDLAKALEYITGAPQGAGLGAQLQLYKEMLQRQREVSTDIIGNAIAPHVQNFSDLREKNPKKFNDILTAAGVALDDNGQFKAYQPKYMKKSPAAPEAPPKGGDGMAVAAPAPAPPAGGKVRISNGKETFDVDPKDLEEALNSGEGFKRMGP